jgi:hypothetical protein
MTVTPFHSARVGRLGLVVRVLLVAFLSSACDSGPRPAGPRANGRDASLDSGIVDVSASGADSGIDASASDAAPPDAGRLDARPDDAGAALPATRRDLCRRVFERWCRRATRCDESIYEGQSIEACAEGFIASCCSNGSGDCDTTMVSPAREEVAACDQLIDGAACGLLSQVIGARESDCVELLLEHR